jgi:cytoskeletal protein CcmA (bactofilin family)|tara:strand:+ start:144 stop:620 length:477 start_codon:yes stop_codon:yes gene_type:complete
MSFLHLKNKIEPKYNETKKPIIEEDAFGIKSKLGTSIVDNSNSSLMIGEGVIITGTIKANSKVTIQGTVDGDIECNSIAISKSGNVKGKIKTDTITVEGKAEGEINADDVLNIKSQGHVSGKVFYGEIQIEEGGKISGEINHRDKDSKQEEFKDFKVL